MAKRTGGTRSVGSGSAASGRTSAVSYGSGWQQSQSSFVGAVNSYKNDKVEVSIQKSGDNYRVQAMELSSITPQGQSLKSDVQYFPTEQQAKSFADSFIKTAEAKQVVRKKGKLPFITKKTGKLDGF